MVTMVTIEDILKIDNCTLNFFDHYKKDHPTGKTLYWGELNPVYSPRKDGKITLDIVKDRMTDPELKDNDLYLVSSYLQYGDYDNSCMIERSNYKIFMESYKEETGVFDISGGYGSTGIAISVKWLLDPVNEEKADEIMELLNGLNDYPCLNDEDMSKMEYDAFYEALKDYGISDTCTALAKKYGIDVTDYDSAKLEELILDIDRNGNQIFIIESGGSCYIDIDDMIVPKITREQFISALTDYEVIQ
jgi:hypothetical protein